MNKVKNFKKTTKTFKFQRHVLIDSPVIFSRLRVVLFEYELPLLSHVGNCWRRYYKVRQLGFTKCESYLITIKRDITCVIIGCVPLG